MLGRGQGPRPKPPVNHGYLQGISSQQDWQQPAWPQPRAPILYPHNNAAPLHGIPGITLQPLPLQQMSFGQSMQAPLAFAGHNGVQQQWATWNVMPSPQHHRPQAPPPQIPGRGAFKRPPIVQGRGPQGRHGQVAGQGGGPRQLGRGSHQARGPVQVAAPSNLAKDKGRACLLGQNASNGQKAKKLRKAMQQLTEEENTPKKARILSPAEIAEGAKWQEERKKNFPTEINLIKRAEQAKQRAERGEIDAESLNKRKTLQSVLLMQRKLGLAKAAGTDTMQICDEQESFQGRGRGQSGRRGRGRGLGRTWPRRVEYHKPPPTATNKATPEALEAVGRNAQPIEAMNDRAAIQEYLLGDDTNNALGLGGYESGREASEEMAQARMPQAHEQAGEEYPLARLHTQALQSRDQDTNDVSVVGLAKENADLPFEAKQTDSANGRIVPKERGRRKRNSHRKGNQKSDDQPRNTPRQSLLQRLLAKEIREEHSFLLQSFRFLVKNNFLQEMDTDSLIYPELDGAAEDTTALLKTLVENEDTSGTDSEIDNGKKE